jgi:threonine aldolase
MARRVDLRSDTVTQPTEEMRDAMARAAVGDDGYGEDPTINELETRFASLVGKEAAVFVVSGVMANQIALRILAQPGDLVVAGRHQHVVSFEMGAAARNSATQFATVDDARGVLDLADVVDIIESEGDHQPHVEVVSVENTHMFSGGVPWDVEDLQQLADAIGDRSLHLDGARLFNAVVATGTSAAQYSASATTVMTCLSKGLCAPVGSLLAGPNDLMDRARVERKRLGGAMRQAGFLAAAGLVALDTMIERLADDHRRARRLAELFASAFPESTYDPTTCRTNIIAFDHPQARALVDQLSYLGVEGGTLAPRRARFVTHAGVSDDDVDFVADVLSRFALKVDVQLP